MLTVAVCTFNRCDSLEKTLESIIQAAKAVEEDLEILVINNNSTDQTSKVIKRFSEKDRRIKEVFEGDQGVANARNKALDSASGEYLVFTDDDVIVDKNWLINMIRVIKEEGPACVGGKVLPLWEGERPEWLDYELFPMLALLDFHVDRVILEIPKVYSNNMCVNTKIAQRYGRFKSEKGRLGTLLGSGEDTDFVLRLIKNGEQVFYDPAPLVWHRVGRNRMRKSYFRKWRYDTERCAARCKTTQASLPSEFLDAFGKLMRQALSRRNFWGGEKNRLLSQLEFMAAAGRVMGLIDRGLKGHKQLEV